jgi:hypothetical protein
MLCDLTKVHTGGLVTPKVTGSTENATWGIEGGYRKIEMAKNLFFKGGISSLDTVIKRIENQYWKIEVTDFQLWMAGFHTFQGEWTTTELSSNKIKIDYTYTLHANSKLPYPFHLFFTKVIWKNYMKQVLRNIKEMAEGNEPIIDHPSMINTYH